MRHRVAGVLSIISLAFVFVCSPVSHAAQQQKDTKKDDATRDASTGRPARRAVIDVERLANRSRPGQVRLGVIRRVPGATTPAQQPAMIRSTPHIDLTEQDIAANRHAAPPANDPTAHASTPSESVQPVNRPNGGVGGLRVIRVDRVSDRGAVAWTGGGSWAAPSPGETAIERAEIRTGHRAGLDVTIETANGWVAVRFGRLSRASLIASPGAGAPIIELEHGVAWIGSADAGRPWSVLVRSPRGERVVSGQRHGDTGAIVRYDAFDGLWVETGSVEDHAAALSLTTP